MLGATLILRLLRSGQVGSPQDDKQHWSAAKSQSLVGEARCFDAQRYLICNANAVAFEGDDFFRVIGEDANVLETEVD